MTLQTGKKDNLEVLLDEFTDVHGTVLLGMHKELLELKAEIDDRLETAIGKALQPISAADSALQARIEAARQVLAGLDEEAGRVTAALGSAREQLGMDLAAARKNLRADYQRIRDEFSRHDDVLPTLANKLEEFAARQADAHAEIAASRSEFQLVLAQIGNQRSTFQQEIAQATARMSALQQEQQSKLSAALKVTDKVNGDSRALLRAFRKRIEALQAREAASQKQRRVEIIVVGLLSLAALAVGIWQTLAH